MSTSTACHFFIGRLAASSTFLLLALIVQQAECFSSLPILPTVVWPSSRCKHQLQYPQPGAGSLHSCAFAGTSPAMALGKESSARDVLDHFTTDLRGKTALVTGGNAGLGLETCKALASRGCRVLLCARDEVAGHEAIESDISGLSDALGDTQTQPPDVAVHQLDLANFSSVLACAERVIRDEKRLDLVVLNAGVCGALGSTVDGLEVVMGTNFVGHALLCRLLLPKLIGQDECSRVVVVASVGHKLGIVDPADLNCTWTSFFGWGSYLNSKLAGVLYTRALHDYLQARGSGHVVAVCLSPGRIFTGIWRHAPWPLRSLVPLFCDRGVHGGAASIVYCCVSPECGIASNGGQYVADCAFAPTSETARDPELRKALWDATESLLSEKLDQITPSRRLQP